MIFSKLEVWYLLENVNKEIYLLFQLLAFLEKILHTVFSFV